MNGPMDGLSTIWMVAEREIRQRLRSRGFVLTTVVLSIVLTIGAALPALLGAFEPDDSAVELPEPGESTVVAVVGGGLDAAEVTALESTFGAIEQRPVADQDEAAALLGDGDEDVAFAIVPGERVLVDSGGSPFGFGNAAANEAAEALALATLLTDADAPEVIPDALQVAPLPVEQLGDEDPIGSAARLLGANIGVIFLFVVLIMYTQMIVNGVIEEKGSRVVELLLAVVPTRQLMAGKVLGLGLVGLGQTLVLFGPGAIVLFVAARDVLPTGMGMFAGALVMWFVLGYAFYSVLSAGAGSLVSRPEEAQAVVTPTNVLMAVGYFGAFAALNAPDSTVAVALGWLPFSAPYVMLTRQAVGNPAWWEVAGSVAVMLVSIVGATMLAARLYRGGILKVGARVRVGDAWRSQSN